MLYLNYLFSKHLLIVKRFGSLREKRYISVHYLYYCLFVVDDDDGEGVIIIKRMVMLVQAFAGFLLCYVIGQYA